MRFEPGKRICDYIANDDIDGLNFYIHMLKTDGVYTVLEFSKSVMGEFISESIYGKFTGKWCSASMNHTVYFIFESANDAILLTLLK